MVCKIRKDIATLISANIPTVSIEELLYLEAKLVSSGGKDWGIWNTKRNDWIRDKSGQIDSRLFKRNIKALLNSLTAKSIIASPSSSPAQNSASGVSERSEPEGSPRDALVFILLLLILGAVVIVPIVIFGIMHK